MNTLLFGVQETCYNVGASLKEQAKIPFSSASNLVHFCFVFRMSLKAQAKIPFSTQSLKLLTCKHLLYS